MIDIFNSLAFLMGLVWWTFSLHCLFLSILSILEKKITWTWFLLRIIFHSKLAVCKKKFNYTPGQKKIIKTNELGRALECFVSKQKFRLLHCKTGAVKNSGATMWRNTNVTIRRNSQKTHRFARNLKTKYVLNMCCRTNKMKKINQSKYSVFNYMDLIFIPTLSSRLTPSPSSQGKKAPSAIRTALSGSGNRSLCITTARARRMVKKQQIQITYEIKSGILLGSTVCAKYCEIAI